MKFRNVSDDARAIPSMNLTVEVGETTPDLTKAQAAGLIGQTEVWAAVGAEAKTTQKKVADKQAEPTDTKENG